jgi:hypothetical protein
MLSPSSMQGYREFQSEVRHWIQVRRQHFQFWFYLSNIKREMYIIFTVTIWLVVINFVLFPLFLS